MTVADVDGSHIRTLLLTFFYRHMLQLLENSYIYIAQPPLYQVTRKKSSRYIHSEKEMDNYLFELGLSDIKIRLENQAKDLDAEEMKQLIDLIYDVEAFISRIERKGIPFREFIAAKNTEDKLPQFYITLSTGSRFVYSMGEFEKIRQEDEEIQLKNFEETVLSIPESEHTEEMKIFKPIKLHFMELYEEDAISLLRERLEAFQLKISDYSIADGASIILSDDRGQNTTCYTLKEVMDFLRENGRKGIEIQRYKGLGEMNADQLWETTMDPQKRTLLQVTLPDAIAADHMFTMLMGEEVPPRRAFIEQHALSVKNLDI
jgi:DNA gyrase subunit B